MQEVIMYRNPIEAAVWSAIMNGSFLPVIAGVLVFFIVFVGFERVLNKGRNFGKNVRINTNIALILGTVCSFITMFWMA